MISRRALLGGITVASATAISGCSGLGGDRDVRSEFVYTAEVNPTDAITDVTLYLPVPIVGGEVVITDRITDYAFEPDGWSLSIADTDSGPMLEVTVDEISARNRTYDMWIDWIIDEEIDTRNALENAPTLQPKDGIEQRECDFPHPEEWDDRLRCYSYDGRFYGGYEPTGTDVGISISLWGDNSWRNGGWRGNSYNDDLHGFVDGTGWAGGRGSLNEGIGTY